MKFSLSKIYLLIAFAFVSANAYPLDPSKKISQYVHRTWGLEQGLPHSSITAITQTHDGYLWLGTEEGVVRFDGLRFVTFDKTKDEEIKDNFILSLLEDRSGTLWIGTMGGLTSMHAQTKRFITYGREDGLSDISCFSIMEDHMGYLWIGTRNGLNRRHPKTGKITVFTKKDGLSGNNISALYQDQDKILWVGTEHGLTRITVNHDAAAIKINNIHSAPFNTKVMSIYQDNQKNIWFGTTSGLYSYKPPSLKFKHYTTATGITSNAVRKIFQDSDNNLWLATSNGLNRIETRNQKFFCATKQKGLTDNSLLALYEDREKNLWIGANFGLNRLKDGKFTSFNVSEGLSANNVWCVLQERDSLWVGTTRGLNQVHKKTSSVTLHNTQNGLTGNNIYSLCKGANQYLWVGTTKGLNRLDTAGGEIVTYTRRQGLSHNTIMCILMDSNKNLWIGTEDGLNLRRHNTGKITSFSTEDGLSNNYIRVLYQGRDGDIWIGTRGGGLDHLNRNTLKFTNYSTLNGLSNNFVRSIYQDRDDYFWIGTRGGGLNRLQPLTGNIKSISSNNGLFNDTIHKILEDDNNNLWMSSNRGVFRVSRHGLNNFCDGAIKSVTSIAYSQKDGMKSPECNGISQPSGWKSADGILRFATMNGVTAVDPAKLISNRNIPPVKIEAIYAGESQLKGDGPRKVEPNQQRQGTIIRFKANRGQKRIEIHFTALSFPNPRHVRFKYKLDGFDQQWSPRSSQRNVSYTQLSPGKYTFRVVAANNDGLWNHKGTQISFYIQPFFYQTWWFIVILILAALYILYSGYRFRIRRIKKRSYKLERMVQLRTDQLNGANFELETLLESLKEANETAYRERESAQKANTYKSKFLANMSHEIRTPMNAILGFSEIMSTQIQDETHQRYLKAILSSGRTLLDLINDILDLSRIEAGKLDLEIEPVHLRSVLYDVRDILSHKAQEKALEFKLEIHEELPEAILIDSLRLRQVLLNLVGNAIKFTHSGYVKLTARSAGLHIIFTVQDTGIGIPKDQLPEIFKSFTQQEGQRMGQYGGSGLGLPISLQLVQMMGGKISVDSQMDKGTTFTITLNEVTIFEDPLEPEEEFHWDVEAVRFENASILVVDDDPLDRQLLIDYLASSHLEFIEAKDGREAVEMTQLHRPNLILMKMNMPGTNGCAATRVIKADESLKNIPVIIVTASLLKEEQDRIKAASGNSYLGKPVSKSDLIIELMHFLPYHTEKIRNNRQLQQNEKIDARDSKFNADENFGHKLLKILKSEPITGQWKKLSMVMIMDELEDFSKQISSLAKKYNCIELSQWAQQLSQDLKSFDTAKIEKSLSQFPKVIRQLELI